MFDADKDFQFWLLVKYHYPSLPEKPINVSLLFMTTY